MLPGMIARALLALALLGLAPAAAQISGEFPPNTFYAGPPSGTSPGFPAPRLLTPADMAAGGIAGGGGGVGLTAPQGRLTLTSGTPVMASSVAAATTVFYTGASGKYVPTFDGVQTLMHPICATNTAGPCELSVALGANWVTNANYDWFIGVNSSVVTLCTGPAWTSDTARGTGAGTTELQQLDGLQTNKNSMTCRYGNATTFTCAVNQCTYVGTMRTGAAGQTNFIYGASAAGGTAANFALWNAFNQVAVTTVVNDSTSNWTYTSATIRSLDNSTGNRVSFISGLAQDGIDVSIGAFALPVPNVASAFSNIGVALDSTSAFDRRAATQNPNPAPATTSVGIQLMTRNAYQPQIGYHFVQAVESSDGANANAVAGGATEGLLFLFRM